MALPHDRSHLLISDGMPTPLLRQSIGAWTENLLRDDAITKVPEIGLEISANINAKQTGVFAGVAIINQLLSETSVQINWFIEDGDTIMKGKIATLEGPNDSILCLERTILNIIGRLSGIATTTSSWVETAPCAVACTRKTTWGLLDKWAVMVGGGLTHRLNKSDALMLKENDLTKWDSISDALTEVDPTEWGFVEIEVTSANQAFEAAASWTHPSALVIMLDNIGPDECRKIKQQIEKENIIIEVSGGIKFNSLHNWHGVDVLSASALNQGIEHVDFSMLFEEVGV
ncbi:nicotinate-nucleotide diphosphorylase (carboxylating) [Deltaproteobacteria bacterium]|nr:nicotinate-nucleotide diphosphorylase (carboxylating) [Deltaproteobacteria bacterium]